jgi:hypothetical protein
MPFKSVINKPEQACKQQLKKANTEAQVAYQEQMTDMRAAMRVQEMQKQQRVKQQFLQQLVVLLKFSLSQLQQKLLTGGRKIAGLILMDLNEKLLLQEQLMYNLMLKDYDKEF